MKTKKLLLFISIILISTVIGLGIIYFKTDLFKATRQKFWKYVNSNSKVTQLYNNEDVQSIKNRRSKNPYEVDSSITIKQNNNEYSAAINTVAKNSNDIMTQVDIKSNDNSIVKFKLMKQSNLIALKMDELANGYIAIKNNDIKNLAKEAGIENTENIPNTINWVSLLDILYVSQSDEKYFTGMISNIISNNTSKSNYSVEESGLKVENKIHTNTGYKLSLSENETKKITIAILKYITEDDSRMLNFLVSKAKMLNLPTKYTNVNTMCDEIKKAIKYIENIKTTDENFIDITVYVEEGKTLQTNIKIKSSSVIAINVDADKGKLNIRQEGKNKELEKSKNKIIQYIANLQELNLYTNVSEDKNSVQTNFDIKFYNNLNIEYSSKTTMVNEIDDNKDFVESSKIVLNELESGKLKMLYSMLAKNFKEIYDEKLNLMGLKR